MAPVDYADGVGAARLIGRPNPRSVGRALFRQFASRPNASRLSGYVYAFGNLLSHDTQRTVGGSTEVVEFRIPVGDDIFLANQRVPLPRSVFDPATGTAPDNPRQQINFATSFLDGSVVYGSNELTASILRGGPASPGAKLRTSNDINGDSRKPAAARCLWTAAGRTVRRRRRSHQRQHRPHGHAHAVHARTQPARRCVCGRSSGVGH